MDKPKKIPSLANQNLESKLCLNCGFPNRESDEKCMYCKTSMLDESGIISWIRQTYYILRWRWQLKQRREKMGSNGESTLRLPNLLGYFFIGALLSGAGLYLFASAVAENSFSSGLIAVLLLFYGVFTLKSLFAKK